MKDNPRQPIRVLIVDDSPTVCEALRTIIECDPQLQVVGTALNGQEAIKKVAQLEPDIVTMDFAMPGMDGLQVIKHIMAYHPTPILVISSIIRRESDRNRVFEAMQYGALDVVDKLPLYTGDSANQLRQRLKTLARIQVITHPLAKFEPRFERRSQSQLPTTKGSSQKQILAIVSSTGGPQALMNILGALPSSLPCGVVIVQHISDGFDRGLADWLGTGTQLSVKLAEHNDVIRPGTVYIAPTKKHMRVATGGIVHLTDEAPCDGQKPSGTILFESVGETYGDRAVCAILTGMGRDGAEGLRQVRARGGYVVAQDEETSVVFGMPKVAIELGLVNTIQPLSAIPGVILSALGVPRTQEVLKP
jgi:two-component system chemotaxis response regulator CheB